MSNLTFHNHAFRYLAGICFILIGLCMSPADSAAQNTARWVATWSSAQQACEPQNGPGIPSLAGHTLRQYIRITAGGEKFQLRLSNEFGREPIVIGSAAISRASAVGKAETNSHVTVTFLERNHVTIPAGAAVVSDPIALKAEDLSLLSVSLYFEAVPELPTTHPGSRTTSYIAKGNHVVADEFPSSSSTDHWFVIAGLAVHTADAVGTIAFLGDSITDGRGSTTNGNDRWPDQVADRLYGANKSFPYAMVNLGIGGNRLLRDGIGPNALSRFDRDILAQPSVRAVVIFEGINDIGGGLAARKEGKPHATTEDLIFAYHQLASRAKAHGLAVFACTILPFEGAGYFSPEGEDSRQKLNDWIRRSPDFDGVIDFDKTMRDPSNPTKLKPDLHMGDWLHPNQEGYRVMATSIPATLFDKIRK